MVSVIVPVFNDIAGIRRCVDALQRQSYPRSRYEVIVVDNGSTDGTAQLLAGLGVSALSETADRGSYAARNTGLRAAVGTVVAFTDADCTPEPTWIERGLRKLQESGADIVAGEVRFQFSPRPSGAEIWDSITNKQIEQNIRERQIGNTANLFVRREAFDAVGPFPSDIASGGDHAWTGRATRSGLRIAYGPDAIVGHPTRRLIAMVIKQFRVGTGKAAQAIEEATRSRVVARTVLRQLLPPSRSLVARQLRDKNTRVSAGFFLRVWGAAWAARAATGAGTVAALAVGHRAISR